jgi:hypothetical protein
MKKYMKIASVLGLLLIISFSAYGQCKTFAKNSCKPNLSPFIHDGNYNAAILTEGEEAELYKTFYSGQTYRIAICGSETLPNIEFKVIDSENNILYDNSTNDYSPTWDFKTPTSQQLKIYIRVPASGKDIEDISSGCVAIMFGFKDED